MSLGNMRCDRCGEREDALFRAKELGNPEPNGWWCEACLKETGSELDEETRHLIEILRRKHE